MQDEAQQRASEALAAPDIMAATDVEALRYQLQNWARGNWDSAELLHLMDSHEALRAGLEAEQHDMGVVVREVGTVYDQLTGGFLSKADSRADLVLERVEEVFQQRLTDELEPLRAGHRKRYRTHSRDVIADTMSEQEEEIARLREGLRWALQYGIFEVSTDNPLHRHAHEDALKAAGMWDCPHSWSGCDGTRLVSVGHALAAILKEVPMQAKRGTG